MAQLNMMGHQWNMGHQGWPGSNLNGSNMSLNIPSPGFMSNDPQMWNPWMQQYPVPMMHNGIPPRLINHSRAASPALSVRSRRSTMSSRNRHKYVPKDLTDDEDSDIENYSDDSRTRARRNEIRNRSRRNTEQIDLDHRDREVIKRVQKMKEKSKYIHERRSGSLTNWPSTNARDSGSLTPSDEEIKKISAKYRKSSLSSPVPQGKRLLSDSASEKEIPSKQKEEKSSQKIIKQVKSDSASERENVKEKSVKANNSVKTKKKADTESESDAAPSLTIIVEKKPQSENRPLKVVNNANNFPKKSNGLSEPSNKKEDKKPVQVEKKEKPKEIMEPSPLMSKPESLIKIEKEAPKQVVAVITDNWECPHCTFVNEALATICTICCKTRVDVLQHLPKTEDDIDINEINDSILQNENEAKQKGKARKISFLPGTKAH